MTVPNRRLHGYYDHLPVSLRHRCPSVIGSGYHWADCNEANVCSERLAIPCVRSECSSCSSSHRWPVSRLRGPTIYMNERGVSDLIVVLSSVTSRTCGEIASASPRAVLVVLNQAVDLPRSDARGDQRTCERFAAAHLHRRSPPDHFGDGAGISVCVSGIAGPVIV